LAGLDPRTADACRTWAGPGERPVLRLLYSYMPRETAVEKCA
jgi:hypothetical protein